jgi:hypothetical protein
VKSAKLTALLYAPATHFTALAVAVAFIFILTLPAGAQAGSLDDFRRANRPAITHTVEESLTAINDYTAALDADLTDEQLSVGQRRTAIYQRAYHWMTLYKCDQAIPGFTTLIEGTDPRVGELPQNDPLFAESYKWRAVCRYTVLDMPGAIGDIQAARRLRPGDYTIRRMDMEMTLSNLPAEG